MTRAQIPLDPITVEVVRNKLEGIANEMEVTLLRSSFSPIVKEGQDASASLFNVKGETLAQACATPVHLGTLIPVVQTFLREFPLDSTHADDIFIMNDPYRGGTHLPDIALVAPIFAQNRPVALAAAMTHHQDVGGMTPGSVPTAATELFQEGIRIPPLKFRDRGVVNETLMKMLRANVRIPDMFMGDIHAQVAACQTGVRRLSELFAKYGTDLLIAIYEELLHRSEQMTRDSIRTIPEGTYSYVDYLDNDGIDLDRRITIQVAVTVRDGTLHFDFSGSSPQVRGPFNCVPASTYAGTYWAIRAITDPLIPTNAGCFRPATFTLPEASIVNPTSPAAVSCRTATIKRISGCILGAFKDVLPERIPADSSGELLAVTFGGKRRDDTPFVIGELIAGGSGASYRCDGVDVIETDASNCMNIPAEALEMDAPIRVNRVMLRRDSGGAGQYRGGLGLTKEYEVLSGDLTLTHRGERHYFQARGSHGGQPGALAFSRIQRAGGEEEIIPSKLTTMLRPGDRLTVETAGGGGFGDPKNRSTVEVDEDLANGKISRAGVGEYRGGTPK
jgi:N-methylhydantoinase B